MDAMNVRTFPTQHILLKSPVCMIWTSLTDEVPKTLFHPTPHLSPSININVSFLFSTFLTNTASNPVKFELLWAITHYQMSRYQPNPSCWSQNFSVENWSNNRHRWQFKVEVYLIAKNKSYCLVWYPSQLKNTTFYCK